MPKKYRRSLLISIKTVSIPELYPANGNMPTYVPFPRKERNRIHQTIGPYHSLASLQTWVLEHMLWSYGVLTDNQHVFRAKRSTETQFICTTHDTASVIQSSKLTHAAVLDFSKAFCKLPHRRPLTKLVYYVIRASLLNRFESFLTQCTNQQRPHLLLKSRHLALPEERS